MFKNINISAKITFVVLGVVVLSVVAVSLISYFFGQSSFLDGNRRGLETIVAQKADKISDYFNYTNRNIEQLQTTAALQSALSVIDSRFSTIEDSLLAPLRFELDQVVPPFKKFYRLKDIYITTTGGKIVYTTNANDPNQQPGDIFNDPLGDTFIKAKDSLFYSNVYRENGGSTYTMLSAGPLKDLYGTVNALLLVKLDLDPVFDALRDTTSLRKTGEYILGTLDNNKAVYLNPLRNDSSAAQRESAYMGENKALPLQSALRGESGADFDTDYRGKEVLAVWRPIEGIGWGLVVKVDTAEIYSGSTALLYRFALIGGVIVIISLLIAVLFARLLVSPVQSLKGTLELLSKGVLPEQVEVRSGDEVGQMAETVDGLVQALRRTAKFANQIGDGNYSTNFTPLSDQDTLGTALITMRDSIQEAEKRDKERNWIVTGVAEIGDILRRNDELEALGDEILDFTCEKIDAIQGAFYVTTDDDDAEKGWQERELEMVSSFAYNKKKYLNARFKFAQGLVGQSAVEQSTVLRTEIPEDYVTITSGILGDKRPSALLIVPLITDERVYGVLEFAGFHKFTPSEVKFVEEISLIVARTVFNIKVNARTRSLLTESQQMSNELQEQQEILRQNAEEMEATQEELRRTNQRLEDQIQEVNRTQKRTQLLLENASEIITIYERDGRVRYISPSVERILGYSTQEMIGHKDIEKVHPEYVDTIEQMFQSLLAQPQSTQTIQYIFRTKDGEDVWLEATGNNLLDDPAIQGLLVNTRDITERRRAEQEQRMRSQMQALSENSPDLITRMDTEGKVFYINPTIESYTGSGPDTYLGKELREAGLNAEVVEAWTEVLHEVSTRNQKVSQEMDFPSEMGDRVMQVNAIPEFNEAEKLESVLVVSHDITERKLIELEIQSKNKKITESINYAKRIQGAILPDNKVIKEYLPHSFILYKARDVVSGDFPWVMRRGDEIFIAAVDCTGHGVPGALISLIGYFLLNDIVRSQRVSDPGKILDLLDEGVTSTLRQDTGENKTKDGMDISLCRVNLVKGTLAYAGAHRPLYYVKDGELSEIKGNKFPIGGGKYRNQTNFGETVLEMNSGDAFYICSDGFPDQFGGEDNRKFGPGRLRELIREVHGKPMHEQYVSFDERWEQWRGDQKQTDDVLLIGARF